MFATLVHVRRRPEPPHYIDDINRYVVLKYFWMLLLNITGDVDHIGESYLQVEDIYNLILAFPAMLDFFPILERGPQIRRHELMFPHYCHTCFLRFKSESDLESHQQDAHDTDDPNRKIFSLRVADFYSQFISFIIAAPVS